MDVTSPVSPGQNNTSSGTPAASNPTSESGSATGTAAISSDFETFLKMLTVQMENQDPLNPIQSADFAVQLATFSGVEQQVRTNDLLAKMASEGSLAGLTQFASWVGQEARAPVATRYEGAPITVYPKMPSDADQATLVVRDADRSVVTRVAIPVSDKPYVWDGTDAGGATVSNGFYSFEIETAKQGQPISTERAEVYGLVSEIRMEKDKPMLVFSGGDALAADLATGIKAPGNP